MIYKHLPCGSEELLQLYSSGFSEEDGADVGWRPLDCGMMMMNPVETLPVMDTERRVAMTVGETRPGGHRTHAS